MMATLDVVERAAAAGKNLIITHETPFYLHQDHTEDIKDDPTLQYKLDFLRKHNMAIFHFHDHWHARQPDGIAYGMMRQLGWEKVSRLIGLAAFLALRERRLRAK